MSCSSRAAPAKLQALADELSACAQDHGDGADQPTCRSPTRPTKSRASSPSDSITVDVLVNNAGFGTFGDFAREDPQEQMRMLQVNVMALTSLTRFLLPGMIERRRGRILNVASTAAFQPGPLMAVYYASKAYVLSLSLALARGDSGHRRHGDVPVPGTDAHRIPGPRTDREVAAVAGHERDELRRCRARRLRRR